MAERPKLRCAVYTRKSTEEGLEQAFNSLDAQREACVAYVGSQRHEGWTLVPELYDDGGYSGGSMDRPGLRQLMADVAAGKVDTIVVYKVDRLTRSLADFAKIVEVLDKAGASFVSVTQAFNTTTSMGRLTLNVLLSFAQFEREVTGERIRDKVAASKAKGMWMGGPVPLGYDLKDRKLVINEAEAAIVRRIFTRYCELRSIGDLVTELARDGVTTKVRRYKDGRTVGGIPFTKGPIAYLLQNRTYTGEVVHNGKVYPGQHEALIDLALWEQAQAILADNRVERRLGSKGKAPSLLTGMLSDDQGRPMMPTFTIKGARRYRYYLTRDAARGMRAVDGRLRMPAAAIEALVTSQIASWLEAVTPTRDMDPLVAEVTVSKAHQHAEILGRGTQREQRAVLLEMQTQVRLHTENVALAFRPSHLPQPVLLEVPAKLVDRGSDLRLAIGPDGGDVHASVDPALLKLMALGAAARQHLLTGKPDSLVDTYSKQHLIRLARVGYLAPDIITAIVEGRQPPSLSSAKLLRCPNLPIDWAEQLQLLGFG
jgi:DNA invertase Pin-like site-specific DNA recombinase